MVECHNNNDDDGGNNTDKKINLFWMMLRRNVS